MSVPDLWYDPASSWTRHRDGVDLPDTTYESVSRLNKGFAWSEWGGIRLSRDRCYFVLPNKTYVLPTTVRRVLGQEDVPVRKLATYLSIPNGQVKNFLNACRAVQLDQYTIRVAVIGSKNIEGTGRWHKYFAMWLARKYRTVVVDFFDYSERNAEWQCDLYGNQITCEWFAFGVRVSDIEPSMYDVVIDDVWTYETGSSLRGFPYHLFKGYSVKGEQDVTGYEPFLHPTETRKFSHPAKDLLFSGCSCLLCRTCKSVSDTYEDYLFLRHMCTRLGHNSFCLGVSFVAELNMVNSMITQLLTQPKVDLRKPAMYRAAMAITEEYAVKADGYMLHTVSEEPVFQHLRRFDSKVVDESHLIRYAWLEGKVVHFAGVPSSILGQTNIQKRYTHQSGEEADVLFCTNIDVWQQKLSASVVYCTVSQDEVKKCMPDWEMTGRKVLHFCEYVRRQSHNLQLEVQAPHQLVGNCKFPPHEVFPFLNSTLHGLALLSYGSYSLDAKLYSIQKQGVYMSLVPFDSARWRQSIWVNGADWGPILSSIAHIGAQYGFMDAAFPLPWNMEPDEIVRLESLYVGDVQDRLRAKYYLKEPINIKERVVCFGHTMSMKQWLNKQGEFKLDGKNVLCKHPMSHVSMSAFSSSVWSETFNKLKKTFSNFSVMIHARQKAFNLGIQM